MDAGKSRGKGIDKPNYTQTPNILFDDLMRDMGEAEFKITMAIIRKTFGNGQPRHKLSLTDFQSMTGLSRQGAINGIEAGIARGTIERVEDGRGGYFYSALVNEVDQGGQQGGLGLVNDVDQLTPPLVNEIDQASQQNGLGVVNDVDQETTLLVNEVDQQEADSLTRARARALVGGGIYDLPTIGRSRKKPTTNQPTFADPHQQLAFDLLVDGEVGIHHQVAEILARTLPVVDIYRVVDDWLPDRRAGKVRPAALKYRLEQTKPSRAPTVTLSSDFRWSELYQRHQLPPEMVVAPERRIYSLDSYPDLDGPRQDYRPPEDYAPTQMKGTLDE